MELITVQNPAEIVDRLERVRKAYNNIDELGLSMKEKGQIHPVLVTRTDGVLELVAGGRRRAAAIKFKLPLDCVVKESMSDLELRELELEENLQRDDLTWQERVRGIAELDRIKREIHGDKKSGRNQGGWSLRNTAEIVSKSTPQVHGQIKLAKAIELLPDLAKAKTEADAIKMLKKAEEAIIVEELLRRKRELIKDNTLYKEEDFIIKDVFQGLKELKGEMFDFANVDTPYGICLQHNKKIQSGVRTDTDYTEWPKDEYLLNVDIIAREVYRTLKPNSWMTFWFGIQWYKEVKTILTLIGFNVDKLPAIWYGGEARSQTCQPELYLARSYETFFICSKGSPILQKRGRSNVFDDFPKMDERQKIHPTEKPLELMIEILDTFVLPHSYILSPLLGSGNDLRAAYCREGRGLGFELDENLKNKFLLRVEEDVKNNRYKKEE